MTAKPAGIYPPWCRSRELRLSAAFSAVAHSSGMVYPWPRKIRCFRTWLIWSSHSMRAENDHTIRSNLFDTPLPSRSIGPTWQLPGLNRAYRLASSKTRS